MATTPELNAHALTDHELEARLVDALRTVGEIAQRLAEARAWFDALQTERDRRTIQRRAQ